MNVCILAVWGLRTFAICNDNKVVKGIIASLGGAILILLVVRPAGFRLVLASGN